MRVLRKLPLFFVATAVLAVGLIGPPAGATTTFAAAHATMTGANEVPGPGAPNGTGSALFSLDATTGRVCYILRVSGISAPLAAHIHKAPAGVAGPVAIPLPIGPGQVKTIAGCTTADPTIVAAIIANPSGYYTNVHTKEFPAGAMRGQLVLGAA